MYTKNNYDVQGNKQEISRIKDLSWKLKFCEDTEYIYTILKLNEKTSITSKCYALSIKKPPEYYLLNLFFLKKFLRLLFLIVYFLKYDIHPYVLYSLDAIIMVSALYQNNTLGWTFIVLVKQQTGCRRVASLGHIFMILSQPIFALSPQCCVLSGESNIYQFYSLWFDPTQA